MISIVRAEWEDARVLVDIKNWALDGLVRKCLGRSCVGMAGVDDVDGEIGLIREYEVYKVMLDGKVIGEVLVRRIDGSVAELEDLVIVPEYQGCGYGTRVLGLIEERYPDVVEWRLSALVFSGESQRLYERAGYVEVERDDVEVRYRKVKETQLSNALLRQSPDV